MQAGLARSAIGPDAKAATPALIAGLGDKFEAVQYASAYALGTLGAKDAVPALQKAAKSKDRLVQLLAIWALAKAQPGDAAAMSRAVNEIVTSWRIRDPRCGRRRPARCGI